ncbi:MAG TPA: tyrosine-protein phosphatase [Mycobacteriales bacterium]|nr:tyrosine-protein phosphatase [Mycobacteriales bacterium]
MDLDGAVNARDLGGLPTADGGQTARGVVIRADNLQGLSERDVDRLVHELRVDTVVDLRTPAEVAHEGPGPLRSVPAVRHVELNLIPNWDPMDVRAERVIPDEERAQRDVSPHYLGYLHEAPGAVIGALRALVDGEGAALVHCAAGKDRTGVVCALALSLVGVSRDDVVEDYLLTVERIEAIRDRLAASPTYAEEMARRSLAELTPHEKSIRKFLERLDYLGGPEGWARASGLTDRDVDRLRERLLA